MRFAALAVSSFLDDVASPAPTPGGGTVAAIAGAMGASLMLMVAGLPRTRSNSDSERAALAEARAAILPLRDTLLVLGDRDADAYDRVTNAFRLPKGTDEERIARKAAVQEALRLATLVPRDTARAAVDVVARGKAVARYGNRAAASDVGVALAVLEAALAGAVLNMRTNLESMEDEGFRDEIRHELDELVNRCSADLEEARSALQ